MWSAAMRKLTAQVIVAVAAMAAGAIHLRHPRARYAQ